MDGFGLDRLMEFVLDSVAEMWPITRVEEWETAMRVRGGIIKEDLKPGLHGRIPWLDEIYSLPSTECTLDLPTATVDTTDGIPVALSANIAYKLVDIRKHFRAVHDGDRSLARMAIGRLASHIATLEHQSLKMKRATLERQLRKVLNEVAKDWGIEVTRVHFTDSVRCRLVIRHYGDSSVGVYSGPLSPD